MNKDKFLREVRLKFKSDTTLKEKQLVISECKKLVSNINKIFLDDFSDNNDIVLADLLFDYFNTTVRDLSNGFSETENSSDAKFYMAVFLYLLGDNTGKKLLLKYAKGQELDKALLVINKLSIKKDNELIPIVIERLENIDFENIDFTLSILAAAKSLNISLPILFLDRLPFDLPWQILLVLKEDFNYVR